ncbi:E3 ubiquitin-protein ligase SIAH1-like [Anoplophora glabripennis]|uniref:E3 ubiquitin-protein ligase SIAH1-like n=1 Tax=Anoplophora glabripennis TaxID=217634 RepID=UPI000873F301|nr:E3 ubiquitin-protein ligase SIAH1-like [Anoplophora glabripennis]XP_018563339.1 E3 ubiquitin-protein ligase SIAH1-like [Anoplophora glabripennis]
MDSHYTDLLQELECPICTNYMSPPIRQCATGHSICEDCRRKLPKCALCQGVFTESRNISLEGLAVKMRYPCINKSSGCNLKLAYNEREIHESKCPFKGYKCAMDECPWVGRAEDIPGHWASKKLPTKPYGAHNVCYTKLKPKSYFVNIVEAFDKVFWFKCKIINKKWCWAVQYIGKASEAEDYWYEIDIFKPERNKRKILLCNYCQSVDLGNSVLFEDACISVPSDVVHPFLNENQTLVYHMRVHAAKGNKGDVKFNETVPARKQRDRSKGPHNKNKAK